MTPRQRRRWRRRGDAFVFLVALSLGVWMATWAVARLMDALKAGGW